MTKSRASVVVGLALLLSSVASAQSSYDVVVVGGGPGGLVAAMSAYRELSQSPEYARTGREPRVLVLEKRGDHPGGEALRDPSTTGGTAYSRNQVVGVKPAVLEALRNVGFQMPDNFRVTEAVEVRTRGESTSTPNRVPTDNPARPMFEQSSTHTIQINELQHLLSRHARSMGIEVQHQRTVNAIEPNTRGTSVVRMQETGGEATSNVRARWVIAADGAGSPTREMVGIRQRTVARQGTMVGAWFEGMPAGNRSRYMSGVQEGNTGVIVGSGRTQYGLFALTPQLDRMVTEARSAGRDLTPQETARINRHVMRVARNLYAGVSPREMPMHRVRVARTMPFGIDLRRTDQVTSTRHRTTIIGDAVRTVNPFIGLGANVAMREGFEAGRLVSQHLGGNRGALRRLQRMSGQLSDAVHSMSGRYAKAFQAPPRIRNRVEAPEGSPLGNARRGTRQARGQGESTPTPRARRIGRIR